MGLSYWFVDRFLPGLSSSAVWALVVYGLHRSLKRHVTKVMREERPAKEERS